MAVAQAKLRPISKPEELAQVPVSEPVLVELPEGATGFETAGTQVEPKERDAAEQGAEVLTKQLEQLKAADAERQKALERVQADATRERQARIAAEQEAERIKELRQKDTKEFFGSALEGAKAEGDAAEMELQQAQQSGDAALIAKAQRRLARAESKLVQLEGAQADFDAAPPTAPQVSQQQQPIDFVARIDADPNLLSEEKAWLKAHPEVILDQRRNAELGVAYDKAVRKGIARGTPAYFKFLNEFMEYETPANNGNGQQRQQDQNERDTNVAAPVSRETLPGSSVNDRRVTLSPEQRELAKSMGLTDIQYAEGVLRLRNEKTENPEKFGRRA